MFSICLIACFTSERASVHPHFGPILNQAPALQAHHSSTARSLSAWHGLFSHAPRSNPYRVDSWGHTMYCEQRESRHATPRQIVVAILYS